MPVYEYKCPNGHVFEVFQRMTDEQPKVCEECGKGPIERVLYPVAVHFKGSGFYSTDYGRGSRKKESARDGDKDGDKPADSDKGDKGGEKDVKKVET